MGSQLVEEIGSVEALQVGQVLKRTRMQKEDPLETGVNALRSGEILRVDTVLPWGAMASVIQAETRSRIGTTVSLNKADLGEEFFTREGA